MGQVYSQLHKGACQNIHYPAKSHHIFFEHTGTKRECGESEVKKI